MEKITKQARKKVLDLIYDAQTSHIGSNFSAIDLMAVIFKRIDLDKDKFVLSAGWKAAALYYFLWTKGRITEEQLNSYCKEGSDFIGLAEPIHPDIPFAGGSMGYGLPAAVGFALAKKMSGEEGTIYCLMSDGELGIGTTWEAAMIAAHHQLGNLVVIVDHNGYQAMGKVDEILNVEPIGAKWMSFGWHFRGVDGHDHEQIEGLLNVPKDQTQPTAIVAETIKGKGVSFMEHNNLYHYKQLSEEEYVAAKKELL